jgi:hypothetical protein
MKRLILLIIFIIAAAGIFYKVKNKISINNNKLNNNTGIISNQGNTAPAESVPAAGQAAEQTANDFGIPLAQAKERVTKKPFGIYITPQNSPVQPEKFLGYHTGTDFEILPGEENSEVVVKAICDGKIIFKNHVNGYGGVIIESCTIDNQAVTVLYGHISLTKSSAIANQKYKSGDAIAVLGQGYGAETNGERKHLHLGIHKGSAIDYRGYASLESQLSGWMDFQKIF